MATDSMHRSHHGETCRYWGGGAGETCKDLALTTEVSLFESTPIEHVPPSEPAADLDTKDSFFPDASEIDKSKMWDSDSLDPHSRGGNRPQLTLIALLFLTKCGDPKYVC